MSDTTLYTSRQYLEEATRRLIDQHVQQPSSTWQVVLRMFRGRTRPARIAIAASAPETVVYQENGTPAIVSCEVRIVVSSRFRDAENADHDAVLAKLLGLVYDATAFQARLITAMEEFADTFILKHVEAPAEAESAVNDNVQLSTVRFTALLVPPELALAAAANSEGL